MCWIATLTASEGGDQRRLPGTKTNRLQTAASTSRNMASIDMDRFISVFLTYGSRMRLKFISVYSLNPRTARIGSSMYW